MSPERTVTEDDLHAYVDQALDPARRVEVDAHLARHADVARRVQGYVEQRAALREALAPAAQEPLPPELSLARLIERRRRPVVSRWQAAAVAVLVFMLGGVAGWWTRPMSSIPRGGIAALAQEAAENYAVFDPDRARPVEIKAENREDLVRWVSKRLDHYVSVPDLTASGYRFMGGRLVATPHGPAALFMYDDDHGTRIVMLIRPMAVDRNTPVAERGSGPVAALTWSAGGMGYGLVGGTSVDKLRPLADEVRRHSDEKV